MSANALNDTEWRSSSRHKGRSSCSSAPRSAPWERWSRSTVGNLSQETVVAGKGLPFAGLRSPAVSSGQRFEDLPKHCVTNASAEIQHVTAPVVRAQIEADADPEQLDA